MTVPLQTLVRVASSLLIFCFLLFFFFPSDFSADEISNPERISSFLEKLDSNTFTEADVRQCVKFAKKAKTKAEKAEFYAIIASYYTEQAKMPAEAIKILQPFLLSEKSSPLSIKTLPFDELEIALCVIEAGRAILFSGKDAEARDIAEHAVNVYYGIAKILSAELASDAAVRTKLYSKAIEWLELALRLIDNQKADNPVDTKKIPLIRKRINTKLEKAKRLYDMARYGEEFVYYQDAETARMITKSYCEAIILYEDLIRFSKESIYSEASKAYIIKSLFELEKTDSASKASEVITNLEKTIEEKKELLKKLKQPDQPKHLAEDLSFEISNLEEKLERLKKIPTGEKAAKLAVEKADAFIAENEYGLYREEILLHLAQYALCRMLDPLLAEKRFIRVWRYLEDLDKAEDKAKIFKVPEKSSAPIQPPATEFEVDLWGNRRKQETMPGMIINRKTCSWYLAEIREQCLLALGFLSLYNRNNEKALEFFGEILKYDEETKKLNDAGEWNNYARLKRAANNGFFNAYPEELEIYKEKQKFLVLLADFYFCIMDFEKSANLAKRLLSGEFGRLDVRQDDYPKYLIALSSYWANNRRGAFLACQKLLLEDKTFTITKDRAGLTAANIAMQIPDEKIVSDGFELLLKLAEAKRENLYVHRARLVLALRLLQFGGIDEAKKWLKKIPPQIDGSESGYHLLAMEYLKAIEEFEKIQLKQDEKVKDLSDGVNIIGKTPGRVIQFRKTFTAPSRFIFVPLKNTEKDSEIIQNAILKKINLNPKEKELSSQFFKKTPQYVDIWVDPEAIISFTDPSSIFKSRALFESSSKIIVRISFADLRKASQFPFRYDAGPLSASPSN